MRYELSDYEWSVIEPMLPNKPRGIPRVDDRRVLNGIFWVLRSGGALMTRLIDGRLRQLGGPMPRSADYDEYHAEARKLRAELRDEALQRVVDFVQTYTAEMSRGDAAHPGRMARRKEELIQAIHEAH